ncbi:MAG TPA: methyltransferase domain-containing protein [Polyangiaceae bacterium]
MGEDEVGALLEAKVAEAMARVHAGLDLPAPNEGEPYSRTVVHAGADCEVMIARWRGGWCSPHDHGGRRGLVRVAKGKVEEKSFGNVVLGEGRSEQVLRDLHPGDALTCGGSDVHALRGDEDAITVHAYAGPDADFRVFSDDLAKVWLVPSAHGAWLPKEANAKRVVWIGFTTKYRGGSKEFARAADTLAASKRREFPGADVRVAPLEFKRDFVRAMSEMARDGVVIDELHFIGHSGMYGVMFGSTKWPEQLSPHEWQELAIPFAKDARAYFHACRTARWFAGFFAGVYGVETFGHHGYTTMSKTPERFTRLRSKKDPVFVVSCPGKKTHGLAGSVKKYLLAAKTFPMTRFTKDAAVARAGYDEVAPLYAAAFEDIRLREAETKWLAKELDAMPFGRPRVLDIGCGTGSLLRSLAPRVGESVGVDVSKGMIDEAKKRANPAHISFDTIEGPVLPFPDASFDVVVSFLSFRYLDWDPIVREIARVLGPNGRLLIVDMVEKPWELKTAPLLARGLWRSAKSRLSSEGQHRALREMVKKPAWREMVSTNPIRAEHEYRWYLESRFPGAKLVTLDVTPTKRTVAFASGAMKDAQLAPLAFP